MKNTHKALALSVIGAASLQSLAADFKLSDDVTASVKGTATVGTMVRMDDPSPNVYTYVTGPAAGLAPGNLIGTTNSADTNFRKNDLVSTVLKATVDLDVHGKDAGVFLRAYGWTDPSLSNDGRPYGNYPNGYHAGSALSDSGFAPEAKFSNLLIRDAYAYKTFKLDDESDVKVKLGRQTLDWGKSILTPGGINSAVNAMDYAASTRPGALPEEGKLATGMFAASLAKGKNWGADGFFKLENVTPTFPGCGTFFDTSSLIPTGCNLAAAFGNTAIGTGSPIGTPASLGERSIYQSGYYVHRGADVTPSATGQWGLSMKYVADSINTEFRGYAINTSSNIPGFHIYKPTAPVSTTGPITASAVLTPGQIAATNQALNFLSSPNGLQYSIGYAPDVQVYGLSFDSKLSPLSRVYGELAVRPNAQLNWNGNDMLSAALLPGQMLSTYKGNAGLVGGQYDAWDRLAVSTLTVGGSKVFPAALGAERVVVLAELGLSHVDGLPDQMAMRYGRAFSYGAAPYLKANGTIGGGCTETISPVTGMSLGVPGKTCTTDGFVTTDAVGVRLNVSARYPNAMGAATLTPALYMASDISGYSYDGTYSQGRLVLRPSLKVEWGKDYYMDVAYTSITGGAYNLAVDKGNLMIAAGLRF